MDDWPADKDWEIKEYYSSSEKSTGDGKVRWLLNKGLWLGKKAVLTGVVISSAPLFLPPLVVFSTLGLACSVPFGLVFASYACTEKLMSKLLPVPTSSPLLEYGAATSTDSDRGEEEELADVAFSNDAMMELKDVKEPMEDALGERVPLDENKTIDVEIEQQKQMVEGRLEEAVGGFVGSSGFDVNEGFGCGEDLSREGNDYGLNDSENHMQKLSDTNGGATMNFEVNDKADNELHQGLTFEAAADYEQNSIQKQEEKLLEVVEDKNGKPLVEVSQMSVIAGGDNKIGGTEKGNQNLDGEEQEVVVVANEISKEVDSKGHINDCESKDLVRSSTGLSVTKMSKIEGDRDMENKDFDIMEASKKPLEAKGIKPEKEVSHEENGNALLPRKSESKTRKHKARKNNRTKKKIVSEVNVSDTPGDVTISSTCGHVSSNEHENSVETENNILAYINSAREIADESGLDLFDYTPADYPSCTHFSSPQENENITSINADEVGLPDRQILAGEPESKYPTHFSGTDRPVTEELLAEEKIWENINALRAIVGYKAAIHPECIEEIKALYVFTGVESSASFKDPSDLAELNEKLHFLMSVVGVK